MSADGELDTHPAAPGLHFNGFRRALSGQLRFMRKDARAIAGAIARDHRNGNPRDERRQ